MYLQQCSQEVAHLINSGSTFLMLPLPQVYEENRGESTCKSRSRPCYPPVPGPEKILPCIRLHTESPRDRYHRVTFQFEKSTSSGTTLRHLIKYVTRKSLFKDQLQWRHYCDLSCDFPEKWHFWWGFDAVGCICLTENVYWCACKEVSIDLASIFV